MINMVSEEIQRRHEENELGGNEREVRNINVFIYQCLDAVCEVINLRSQFNIIYIMRT